MRLLDRVGTPFATALACLLLVAGCAQLGATIPSTSPLLTIELRGGDCPEGICSTTVILERDGRVHQAAKPPNDLGVVPPATLAALDAAIRATDFAALRSRPFTGECPTAYDGQELVLEFGAPGGTERIASCETEIDFGSPVFVALSTALGPFVPLPTT